MDTAFLDLHRRARRLAHRILGDAAAAEDVASEAILRAYSDWERLRDLPYRDAWVMRVATNLALKAVRRAEPAIPAPDDHDESEAVTLRLALVEALRQLPVRQREAVALRYLADLSQTEVAQALGISVGSVKTHVHRGVVALRGTFGVISRRELDVSINSIEDAIRAVASGTVVTARLVEEHRNPSGGPGSYTVDIGMPAVLRNFQFGDLKIGEPIGREVEVRVVDVDRDEGIVYVSRKAVLESDEVRAVRRRLLESLQVGEQRTALIHVVLPFGCLVTLEAGVHGVLPRSEYHEGDYETREEWNSLNEPGEGPIRRGHEILVEVTGIDLGGERARVKLVHSDQQSA